MTRTLTTGAVLALAGSAMAQFSDDFNRADGPIGGSWGPGAGTFSSFIVEGGRGGQASGANQAIRFTGGTGSYNVEQSVDVFINGTSLQYVALVSGLGSTFGSNLYIKVQGGSTFTNIGFYTGLNGSGWAGSAPAFTTVSTPFTAARMTVRFENGGDTLVLEFDTDFNGTPDQSYVRTGVAAIAPSFGQEFGIGAYGAARWDNWQIGPGGPPPCYADCDSSTGIGVLDIFDFLCFQNRFAASAAYACECDTSTGPGVCDIFDFLCFQNAFAAGCP